MALSPLSLRLLPFGVALVAAALGLLAVIEPLYAIGGAAGIAFVALTTVDLTVGVALFVLVAFLEVLPGFGALSAAKLAGGVLVLSWIAASAAAGVRRPQLAQDHSLLLVLIGVFLAWVALSSAWAVSPGAVGTALIRFIPNLLLFPIIFSAVRSGADVRLLLTVFVVGALVSTAYGAFVAAGDLDAAAEGRVSGANTDPNYLAASLVSGMALCAGTVATIRYSLPFRAGAFCGLLLLFVALVSTASRTGIVALLVATVFAVLTAGRGRRLPATIIVTVLLGAGVVYITQAAPLEARQRLQQIDATGTGRTDIWKVATRVIEAHPVVGIGSGNFPLQSVHYLLEPGQIRRSDFIVDTPKVTHNVYLGMWAELGAVGLLLFVGIATYAVRSALGAARRFQDLGDRRMELLARSAAVAMIGQLAASFFVSYEYDKALWIMLAIGPCLLSLSRRATAA